MLFLSKGETYEKRDVFCLFSLLATRRAGSKPLCLRKNKNNGIFLYL